MYFIFITISKGFKLIHQAKRFSLFTICALLSTDVVSHFSTVPVIPEVVTSGWPQRVPVLHVGHAELGVKVVRLAIPPVEPVQGSVRVRPHPVTVHMVRMMVLHPLVKHNSLDIE